ncbi:hypothetical protein Q604_UNBc4C00236G0001, partial [human gut metagenome]
EDGECIINRGIVIDGYSTNKTNIKIPREIDGIEVIEATIQFSSEYEENKIESIEIPETVEQINIWLFF